MECKLCGCSAITAIGSNATRSFHFCPVCELIFVPSELWLSPEEEKARYANHENGADNPDYARYLTGISHEIDRVPITYPRILDFGSGTEYVLTRVLRKRGFECEPYDPVYNLGEEHLSSRFDIVIICETIEHVKDIQKELLLLRRVCKPEGYILVHTELYPGNQDFLHWWYALDQTHIIFFNTTTMSEVSHLLKRGIFYTNNKNVLIFGPEKRAI
jgi:SAM-dependent methyltransferase